jgi:DNA repair protein RadC
MESRMKRKFHVRFGERDGENRAEKSVYGVPVPTLREVEPSPDDVAVTRAIVTAGKTLDINVIDHIICGRNPTNYASLKERGLGFS